jgi:MFS family permease
MSSHTLCPFIGTVVATLLAPIGSYFNKSNQSSYIGTSYLLSVCCFTPLYGKRTKSSRRSGNAAISDATLGRLSDILGRKGAMLLALFLFGELLVRSYLVFMTPDRMLVGSGTIFCGVAPSMETLIIARAVAGMGGGGCVWFVSVQ